MRALDERGPKRALYLAPFDELADPGVLVDLAVRAEARGWDGIFLWDHIVYRPPVSAVADPWVALSAIAAHKSQLRLGPTVTPLSRRRVPKLARETVTLDRLSGGGSRSASGLGTRASWRVSAKWRIRGSGPGNSIKAWRAWRSSGRESSSRGRCSSHGSLCGRLPSGRIVGRFGGQSDGTDCFQLISLGRTRSPNWPTRSTVIAKVV